MASKENRYQQNVPGKFFVDDQCIACDACCVEAPRFFAMNDEDGHAYVKLQPSSLDDIKEALNALAACPVEAIGDDG